MIKNIIFDFGGVVVTISHDEALRRFTQLGLPDAEKWLDPYTQTGIFGELEEGLLRTSERNCRACVAVNFLSRSASMHGWAIVPMCPGETWKC